MSTLNICFHGEIKKMSALFGQKSALSGFIYFDFTVVKLLTDFLQKDTDIDVFRHFMYNFKCQCWLNSVVKLKML